MSDLINRWDALDALQCEWCVEKINNLPSANRPTGEWVNREKCQVDEDAYEVATCSECRVEITIEYPYDSYCPNCGAKINNNDNE